MSGLRVLVVTSMWPSAQQPWRGKAVEAEVAALEALGVSVELERIRPGGSFGGYARAAAHALRDWKATSCFDVVHAYYGHCGLIARLRVGAPVVITYCGSDLNGVQREDGSWTWQSRAEVAVFRQLARLADATITMTTEMAQRLPVRCQARNHVIPSGVDLRRFATLNREDARRRLGWPADVPTVLFIGDPGLALKNYPLAQACCAMARRDLPALRLRVAWEIAPEEIPIWMQAADALLMTSHAEGSPNVVKEAMAAGLPVVSTPVGDVAERLSGIAGCFVRPADPQALADALLQALQAGRCPQARRAVQALSIDATARRVLDVYEEVVRYRATKMLGRGGLQVARGVELR